MADNAVKCNVVVRVIRGRNIKLPKGAARVSLWLGVGEAGDDGEERTTMTALSLDGTIEHRDVVFVRTLRLSGQDVRRSSFVKLALTSTDGIGGTEMGSVRLPLRGAVERHLGSADTVPVRGLMRSASGRNQSMYFAVGDGMSAGDVDRKTPGSSDGIADHCTGTGVGIASLEWVTICAPDTDKPVASVLCGCWLEWDNNGTATSLASLGEPAASLFRLYDVDDDGILSPDEAAAMLSDVAAVHGDLAQLLGRPRVATRPCCLGYLIGPPTEPLFFYVVHNHSVLWVFFGAQYSALDRSLVVFTTLCFSLAINASVELALLDYADAQWIVFAVKILLDAVGVTLLRGLLLLLNDPRCGIPRRARTMFQAGFIAVLFFVPACWTLKTDLESDRDVTREMAGDVVEQWLPAWIFARLIEVSTVTSLYALKMELGSDRGVSVL